MPGMILERCEDALEKYGYFAGPPVGTSMLPLLRQDQDVVVIRPCETVRLLDVILYRRANGDTVLHRVVGKRKNGYILRGDNQIVNEYGVKDMQVIGKMTAFYREGKEHSVQETSVRLYGFGWWLIYPLRYLERGVRGILGRICRKLRNAN